MPSKPLVWAAQAAFVLLLISTTAVGAAAAPTVLDCPTPRVPYGISTECAQALSDQAIAAVGLVAATAEPAISINCPPPRVPYGISSACARALSVGSRYL